MNSGTAYSIVPASIRHVRPMSSRLRAAACVTLQGFGFKPREALRRAFVDSYYSRTALVGNRPVAMWGVKGSLLDEAAMVWLVLSEEITQMPRAIVREARAELARVMLNKSEIAITVLPDDEAAIRFAVHLGFHDRDNDDGSLSRRAMCEAIVRDPQYRVPLGENYVIALGYHPGVHH